MFGDKRVIDEGAFERAQQGISDRNKTAYQNYRNALEDSWKSSRETNGFYSVPLLNKFVEGMSGGGWSKKDFLNKYGIDDEVDAAGQAGLLNKTSMDSLYNIGNNYSSQRLKDFAARKNLASGVPILGEILNPVFQTFSVAPDLISSGTEKWKNGERDTVSDIGAGIETLVDIATLGSMAGAGGAAKAAPATLKSAIGTAAKRGALVSGASGLGNYLRQNGKDSNIGDAALNTVISTGLGGIIGGAVGGLGYGIGKLRSNAITGNQNVAEAAAKATQAQQNVDAYKQAMDTAQKAGLDTTSKETLDKTFQAFQQANHPDKVSQSNIVALLPEHASSSPLSDYYGIAKGTGAGADLRASDIMSATVKDINAARTSEEAVKQASRIYGPVESAYKDLSKTTLADLLGESKAANQALKKASNQALLDYLKGTKLGKLGSSKLGKAAAVGGTAYGISRLLGNRNGGNNE